MWVVAGLLDPGGPAAEPPLLFARPKFIRCLMGQFEMKYPSEASCAVSEVSLPLQDYFRNVEEESSAALRKEVFRFFIFLPGV